MKSIITITVIVFDLLTSTIAGCQNIFDSTTIGYYRPDINERTYVPTKFESYIKAEVQKTLFFSNRIILANFNSGGLNPDFTDTNNIKFLTDRYIILAYTNKKEWTAISYLEISEAYLDSTTFFKSMPVKLSENNQLFELRNRWDSLGNDWFLPFIYELELNGKKGYFPSSATDMGQIDFYAIDTAHAVFKTIYENDLSKEWNWPGFYTKNVNFEYNYSQPSFAAILYLMTLFESKTFFSGFKPR